MSRDKRSKGQGRDGTRFVALPNILLDSAAYLTLSFSSRALLIDLARQYTGTNNGRLTVCDKVLRPRGWTSKTTIHKAKSELLTAGFLCETRKGHKPNKASWFALTWQALDWSPEMDVQRAGFVRSAYLKTNSDPQKVD